MIAPDPGDSATAACRRRIVARHVVAVIGGDEADEVQRLDAARLAREQLLAARDGALPVAAPFVDGRARQDQPRVAVRVAVLAQRLVQPARRARGVAALLVDLAERDRQLDAPSATCAGVSACDDQRRRVVERALGLVELPLLAQDARRRAAAPRRSSGSRLSTPM